MTDLFEHTADKHRDLREIEALRARIMKLERENHNLRIMLANALSSLRPLWHAQARGTRKAIREVLA